MGTGTFDQTSENSLTANSLTSNSLTANSLTANSLTGNALTASALTSNVFTAAALQDPAARAVLKYVLSCALPAGAHVDITVNGTVYGYDGQLGLATSWGDPGGHCDGNCQAWVSGCVLARINYLGQQVPISARGAKLKTTAPELTTYPDMDGTYYGNIFTQPQIRFACLPPGATSLPRVCGPSLTGCVVSAVGPCTGVCDNESSADGSFPNCRDRLKSLPGAKSYPGTVTVFLQP